MRRSSLSESYRPCAANPTKEMIMNRYRLHLSGGGTFEFEDGRSIDGPEGLLEELRIQHRLRVANVLQQDGSRRVMHALEGHVAAITELTPRK